MSNPPILIVNLGRPNECIVAGHVVRLQRKQFKLLAVLAADPGNCVDFDRIYAAMWGPGVFVEENQMKFQKCRLLQRIAKAVPHMERFIKSVHGVGFVLDLAPGQVEIRANAWTPNPQPQQSFERVRFAM